MTKKILLIAAVTLIAIISVFITIFYWQNLRGIGPAISKPAEDITEIINEVVQPGQSPTPGEDNTNFPLKLPEGYFISIYAKGLTNARVMQYDPAGRILVSEPSEGKVVAIQDKDGDGTAETIITVISGLNKPHGLATKCNDVNQPQKCKLYIAETNQLAVYDYDEVNAKAINKKKLADLPADGYNMHFSRTIMFMPYPDETKILISIGSSCNVCNEENPLRASVQVYDTATGTMKEFAKGLRNSVFMAIHPVDGRIWATEMGRDLLGDNIPPDEVNIVEEGKNYGWPNCYGKNVHDDAFDKNTYIRNPCMEPFETPSYIDLQAHSAPLGLAFFPEEGWPEDYWYNMLVAYHGSWNRTEPTGYKIVRYKLDAKGNVLGSEDFITGWINGKSALGRPVDILIQPGGTIFISDDKAGVIYRVIHR